MPKEIKERNLKEAGKATKQMQTDLSIASCISVGDVMDDNNPPQSDPHIAI
jgi:hypothetical protein